MLTIGTFLQNRYRIESLLGKGGMGAVYRAVDHTFNAPVAIKENLETTSWSQKQFIQEAQLLYQLRHPHIPRVIDYFLIPRQGQYLVMDYVPGENLEAIVKQYGSLGEAEALACMAQVLDALIYLHGQAILHRDVKPANIKLTPAGTVFLVDFELAKAYDPAQPTTVGARAVTPGYAPPEQYGAGRTDARSDLYSAGATLYALLTGHALPDALELMTGTEQLVEPRQLNTAVSPEVEAVILRAMAFRADARFQTAVELQDALRQAVLNAAANPTLVDHAAWTSASLLTLSRRTQPPPEALPLPLPAESAGTAAVINLSSAAPAAVAPRPAAAPEGGHTTPTPSAAPARQPFEPELILIPAGAFLMGSDPLTDAAARQDERPQHRVFLPDYYLAQAPVTNAQYAFFIQHTRHPVPNRATWRAQEPPPGKAEHPVVEVSWHDAVAYCRWLAEVTGKPYRLPTEAEWEKGARGTDGFIYPWGQQWLASHCNSGEAERGTTTAVGAYPQGRSPYGLWDMAGNVFEWTATLWGKPSPRRNTAFHYQAIGGPANIKPFGYPYQPNDGREAATTDAQSPRVVRGGSFLHAQHAARCAYRDWSLPYATFATHGFRVTLSR